MDVELIHKPGWDNLVPDVLSYHEKWITPKLLMIVDDELGDAEQNFLDEVWEVMKGDLKVVYNNERFNNRML